jgi:hypothetical protein
MQEARERTASQSVSNNKDFQFGTKLEVSDTSILRKFSEDAKLRPFLSSHFNSQEFIKQVIREGNSEEMVNDIISTNIVEVNEEIQSYITQHKDDLMGGMQVSSS